jgi:hypothetical protein
MVLFLLFSHAHMSILEGISLISYVDNGTMVYLEIHY